MNKQLNKRKNRITHVSELTAELKSQFVKQRHTASASDQVDLKTLLFLAVFFLLLIIQLLQEE